MVMRRLLAGLACWLLPLVACAQSNPGFFTGQIPTAAQWNGAFALKMDATGGICTGCSFVNPQFSGPFVFGVAGNNTATITPGAAGSNAINLSQSGTGGFAVDSGSASHLTFNAGNATVPSGQDFSFVIGGAGRSINFGCSSCGLGQALTVTTNSGGNAGDGSTGNKVVSNNILQSAFYATPGNAYTLSGTAIPQPLAIVASYGGTTTSGAAFANKINISSDTVDASGAANGLAVLQINDNVNAGAHGTRQVFVPSINIAQALTLDSSSQAYQPIYPQAQASVNVGGTDTSTNAKGQLYGGAHQAVLHSGATNWSLVNGGGEDDLAVESGATVKDEILRSFVLMSTHAVSGARTNYGLFIGSGVGAVGTLVNPVIIGGLDGPWPAASTAKLFGTDPQINCGAFARSCQFPAQLATYGVSLQNVNFSQQSGYGIATPGFAVDGTGQGTFGGGLSLATTSSGYKIDVPNAQVVTAIAINTAGNATGNGLNNYYPGDIVLGTGTPTPGQYKVTHTKALAATIVAGGSGGTNGTCTVVGTTGTGTPAQFNVTISGGAITAVNSVSVPGDYTVNPTGVGETSGAKNAEPVSNQSGCGSIAGATLNIGMGVLTATILVPDVFNACPGTFTPTGGSGAALVLTPTCTAESTIALNPTGKGVQIGSASETLAAGEVGMTKIAASGSAPGAAGGKFALVCGTGAGTAKLIIYAGTSTTPATVVDNIGGGVTGC